MFIILCYFAAGVGVISIFLLLTVVVEATQILLLTEIKTGSSGT